MILAIPLALSAQSRSFRELYGKYSGRDGYTTIEISGEMMNAIGSNVTVSGSKKNVSSLMSKMKNMMIVITSEGTASFAEDVENMIKTGGYTSMTDVNDGRQSSRFYVVRKNDKITEFLMTVMGEGDNVLICIVGDNLDIAQVTSFAKNTAGQSDDN